MLFPKTENLISVLNQVYEPVEEGSYIKMIDMVSGQGGQIQVGELENVERSTYKLYLCW